MKNFFIAAISMAMVSSAFAQNQPQGTWYLGTANATDVVNIFADGVNMSPTIGYAVADNFVLSLSLNTSRMEDVFNGTAEEITLVPTPTIEGDSIVIVEVPQITTTAYTETSTYTESALEIGASYFFDDNYYVGVGLNSVRMSNEFTSTLDAELDTEDENSALGLSLSLGKFIPVRENWYLTPNVNYSTYGSDDDINEVTQSGLSFNIGFGARF
jgi:outer membrane protein W